MTRHQFSNQELKLAREKFCFSPQGTPIEGTRDKNARHGKRHCVISRLILKQANGELVHSKTQRK